MVRTRFAPSPTGYLHIGGARTALYAWAYARKHGGQFILRVEDTDQERSSADSVQAILDSMSWLGLDYDEGPVFQMDRLVRYREVAESLLIKGKAYWCYATPEELTAMREAQRGAGLKPRYDGRWRPENSVGKTPPEDIKPVLRFRNPDAGDVVWDDLVKGKISVSNEELDDFVLLRGDGTPTYNFGVVVDDHDMNLTHVIRGDDHVNNTPRQINVYQALNLEMPVFGHVPMILGDDGERLSKRHGAVSVTQYRDDGVLPDALLNYLARLGWSHGDEEVFTKNQFVAWFDLEHVSRSPAKFDGAKLNWINGEHIKLESNESLADIIRNSPATKEVKWEDGPDLPKLISLIKDRATSIHELVESVLVFFQKISISEEDRVKFLTPEIKPVIDSFTNSLRRVEWERASIGASIKNTLKEFGIKMPQLAMPLRLLLTGQTQTPAIDAVIELIGREQVLRRLEAGISSL
ncbi:MAG: glutamate--tRNA ligase [Burkholderiales bacterium]|nr:glutamate--tRNA ligase [Burkholderiales bacterium]OUT79643.1 MAG: glutamate--tRNA ligase [Betaproteobacteria bacterium TMED22]|tara:strand:- start:36600 stop:37994 length:1395 start_codon:yes stop_codon:yes gene_type:complete